MEQNASHNERLRKTVKGFYAYLGSVLLAVLAPFAARTLIADGATWERVAGVAFGTIAWIPLIVIVGMVIHQGDEFVRRIHLVAIAYAFALVLVFIACIDWLTRAHLIPNVDLTLLWVGIAMLWVMCLVGSKWYYERQQ